MLDEMKAFVRLVQEDLDAYARFLRLQLILAAKSRGKGVYKAEPHQDEWIVTQNGEQIFSGLTKDRAETYAALLESGVAVDLNALEYYADALE